MTLSNRQPAAARSPGRWMPIDVGERSPAAGRSASHSRSMSSRPLAGRGQCNDFVVCHFCLHKYDIIIIWSCGTASTGIGFGSRSLMAAAMSETQMAFGDPRRRGLGADRARRSRARGERARRAGSRRSRPAPRSSPRRRQRGRRGRSRGPRARGRRLLQRRARKRADRARRSRARRRDHGRARPPGRRGRRASRRRARRSASRGG